LTFTVPHIRQTKQGRTTLTDPRDVYELVANQGARRLRACILAVIPGDVVEDAVVQCEETMRAEADLSPAGLKKILDAFAQYGITKAQIEKRIQREFSAIQPAQVVGLKKVYASLRDGMSAPLDHFDPSEAEGADHVDGANKTAQVKSQLAAKRQPKRQEAAPPAAEPPPALPDGDEQ
jgi:hypothetical protein